MVTSTSRSTSINRPCCWMTGAWRSPARNMLCWRCWWNMPGEIIPREALLMQVWGYGGEVKTRTLDVHVRRLRKKLGRFAEPYIETIFGIGYRFQPYHAPRFMPSGSAKPAIAV